MRGVPEEFHAPPQDTTPVGLLVWMCRRQRRSILAGTLYDLVWLFGLALTPWAIGQVIDVGLVPQDGAAFAFWIAVVIWLQLQHSLVQGLRDRAGILNFRRGFARIYQLVNRTAARNATAAERRLSPGEIATMTGADAFAIGFLPIVIGGFIAAVAAYALVGVLLLRDSPLLGMLVIVGVPAFSGVLFVLVRPLERRQSAYRDAAGAMNAQAADSIRGLRVLRGIGGEAAFVARYRSLSQTTRKAGVRVAWPVAGVEALQLAVSGILLVGLTWIGAVLVAQGQLKVGELVAFYGYAGFMVLPVRLVSDAVNTTVQSVVGARRIVGLLSIEPLVSDDPASTTDARLRDGEDVRQIEDSLSGVVLNRGELLSVAAADPAETAGIADRMARLVPDDPSGPVRIDGVVATTLPVRDVRQLVVVADPAPYLFSGTLRTLLDPHGRATDDDIVAALAAADATDILRAAREGLDTVVGERGREFSGGQRQRLGVARALLAADDVLILLDPTSAVDAATESAMARGIRRHRAGATTMVASASPLVLEESDRVAFTVDGEVAASGTHEALRDTEREYARLVRRGEGMT